MGDGSLLVAVGGLVNALVEMGIADLLEGAVVRQLVKEVA